MKLRQFPRTVTLTLLLLFSESLVALYHSGMIFPISGIILFIALNIYPIPEKQGTRVQKICSGGAALLTAFLADICLQAAGIFIYSVRCDACFTGIFWLLLAVCAAADWIVFWNGIIRVYLTSSIISVKWRVLGILCGMIPVLNILVLCRILKLVRFDLDAERERDRRNQSRAADEVCKTKYPLLLVHGVFFRDVHFFDYWGRIPGELKKNGATVYYGGQQSALSVSESAAEIAAVIRRITGETGCGKVNVIAHSKGGLDCRYAVSRLGMAPYVASLTTVNTPHRGCAFADWLLHTAPEGWKNSVAGAYNRTLLKLGDTSPDFLSAVNDLTAGSCAKFNRETPDVPGVFCQSIGSRINKPFRNVFPLCFTHFFVRLFDGANDGLVSVESAKWGERFTYLATDSAEGISHADVIDLTRHNRLDFDVCEFYVGFVNGLKQKDF